MKTKEKKIKITLKLIIYMCFAFFGLLYLFLFCNMYFPINKTQAKETIAKSEEIKIRQENEIDIN